MDYSKDSKKPKTGVEAKRKAVAEAKAKKVRESYRLPGGGTKYDSFGKKNMFSIPGPKG